MRIPKKSCPQIAVYIYTSYCHVNTFNKAFIEKCATLIHNSCGNWIYTCLELLCHNISQFCFLFKYIFFFKNDFYFVFR